LYSVGTQYHTPFNYPQNFITKLIPISSFNSITKENLEISHSSSSFHAIEFLSIH